MHVICAACTLTWEGEGRGAVSTGTSIFFAAERGGRAGFGRWCTARELAGFTVWEGTERNDKNCDKQYVTAHCQRINQSTARLKCNMNAELGCYLSSRWGVLCTEHPENSSPGSILSASASWAGWITSGWCGLKTQWSIWNPFPHSPHSFLKSLKVMSQKWNYCIILQTLFTVQIYTVQSGVSPAKANNRA